MANIYLGPGFTQTSVTGPRKVKGGSSCHRGVDMAASAGAPVPTLVGGVVSWSGV